MAADVIRDGLPSNKKDELPTATMLLRGLSFTAHPGKSAHSVRAICPMGSAVLNWSRVLMKVPIQDPDAISESSGTMPSPVLAIPCFSGACI